MTTMNIEEVRKLSDEELMVRVAELCGWSGVHWDGPEGPILGYPRFHSDDPDTVPLPDYCNDLNAIAEAEKVFSRGEEWTSYYSALDEICEEADVDARSATARQRAEAFLLTMS